MHFAASLDSRIPRARKRAPALRLIYALGRGQNSEDLTGFGSDFSVYLIIDGVRVAANSCYTEFRVQPT